MKHLATLSSIIAFAFTLTAFAQGKQYPFEVKVSGNGKQSIIFIPGFACSGDVWTETKALYEKDHTCYTLTMAGFAGTKPEDNPSFKGWEDGIAAYIVDNKMNKPIIVGHSMGGGLAMAIAADYPSLPLKIVVVDALPCLAALMNPAFKSKDVNDCTAITSQVTGATDEQFLQMQKQSMQRLVTDQDKQDLVVTWSMKSDRKTFGDMYCDFSNTDLREKIKGIKCPALVLLESYFVNLKPSIEGQFKNLKTADLRYSTKGLHFIMYDDKSWYDQQLADFIKR
jgi:pimeloyl-ACP methyl ester carboxylesterase